MAYAFPGLVVLLLFELTGLEPFLSGMTWINAIGQGAMNQRAGNVTEGGQAVVAGDTVTRGPGERRRGMVGK
jgi:hypothetical protein